jgi:hypothetical protein
LELCHRDSVGRETATQAGHRVGVVG